MYSKIRVKKMIVLRIDCFLITVYARLHGVSSHLLILFENFNSLVPMVRIGFGDHLPALLKLAIEFYKIFGLVEALLRPADNRHPY